MPASTIAETTPKPLANATPPAVKRTARSRVSNGTALFLTDGIDPRSVVARRYRDVLAQLVSDLGGDPSEAQAAIAKRAATLIVWAEQAESAMAAGDGFDVAVYTTACNSLRRLLADLGLERKARDITGVTLRDRLMRARKPAEANVVSAA